MSNHELFRPSDQNGESFVTAFNRESVEDAARLKAEQLRQIQEILATTVLAHGQDIDGIELALLFQDTINNADMVAFVARSGVGKTAIAAVLIDLARRVTNRSVKWVPFDAGLKGAEREKGNRHMLPQQDLLEYYSRATDIYQEHLVERNGVILPNYHIGYPSPFGAVGKDTELLVTETAAAGIVKQGGNRGNTTVNALASGEIFSDQWVDIYAVEGDTKIAEKKAKMWNEVGQFSPDELDKIPAWARENHLIITDYPDREKDDPYEQGRFIQDAILVSGNQEVIDAHTWQFDIRCLGWLAEGGPASDPLKAQALRGKSRLQIQREQRVRRVGNTLPKLGHWRDRAALGAAYWEDYLKSIKQVETFRPRSIVNVYEDRDLILPAAMLAYK